jgi:predicted ribosome quality control (RQC) complex YloA/Tae2 family protein
MLPLLFSGLSFFFISNMGSEENNLSQNHIEEQPSENNQTADGDVVDSNSEGNETGHEQSVQNAEESKAREGQISKAVESDIVNRLNEEIKRLEKEITEQKETQKAAEAALEHLRVAHTEADGKAQELSQKLVEG